MPLGQWLQTFQQVHHEEETRIRDVLALRADPRPRNPSAINNDLKLAEARDRLEEVLPNNADPMVLWEFMQKYLTRVGAIMGYAALEDADFDVSSLDASPSSSSQ
ncbi:hypothetical protein QR680_018781 [Steinernema hermaphroditum]|uniref:Uncharacterized protein n=1 Tax=Steinernema hermaphroditum TaxID=289476 RepID=A0AA39HIZ2_9BILA|nr:hypothetical protein QR680_018781 [Steinernema hermaphroditum]